VIDVLQTEQFDEWLTTLRDERAKALIAARIDRLRLGHFGDVRSVGHSIIELRVAFGPGYRLYATERGKTIVLVLCGGDKGTQRRDIKRARQLLEELED